MLQTDSYNAYNIYEKRVGITLHGCMAHARRKFEQAKDNDLERAAYVLERTQKLYMTEREAREKDLSFEQRRELRAEKSLPVLQELEKRTVSIRLPLVEEIISLPDNMRQHSRQR